MVKSLDHLGFLLYVQAKEFICRLIQRYIDSGARLALDGRNIVVSAFTFHALSSLFLMLADFAYPCAILVILGIVYCYQIRAMSIVMDLSDVTDFFMLNMYVHFTTVLILN